MKELTAPWTYLAQTIGLPEPSISWNLTGSSFHPISSQVFYSSTSDATLLRADNGWEIAYREGPTCRITLNGSLSISIGGFQPDSPHHATLLAGPVTALIISACGFYPLHAAGIQIGQRLFAVHASSGGGKSSLAACAARHGMAISGDDLLAATETGMIESLPGALRVSPGLAPPGWSPVRLLPDGRGWYPLSPLPRRHLAGVLLLQRGGEVGLVPERGAGRLVAMMRAGSLSHLVSDPPPHWHRVIDLLAGTVPVWRLSVPEGLDRLNEAWPVVRRALEQASGP